MHPRVRVWLSLFCVLVFSRAAIAQPGRGGSGRLIDPAKLGPDLGVAKILDHKTFDKLSYQGPMRMDAYLSGLQFVKFIIADAATDTPIVYWMNTKRFQAHPRFSQAAGIGRGRGEMRGAVTYLPRLKTPDGGTGLYIFDFQPNSRYSFEDIEYAYNALVKTMPILKGKTAFHPLRGNLELYNSEKAKYKAAKLPVHLDEDLFGNIGFLPLNEATSFGRLRLYEGDFRASPRDIVLCKTLPNQMPRVAGVITAERQTPLSHVNLRAVQDKVPNAFVFDAMKNKRVTSLVGKLVRYEVNDRGYSLREATQAEVDAHFRASRPNKVQKPSLDLTKKTIEPLSKIGFGDSQSYGGKTSNVAALHTFDLPKDTIPDGHGIPFHFYAEFMKHNGLDKQVAALLTSEKFGDNVEFRRQELKSLREKIEKGTMPEWMMTALAKVQATFPKDAGIRCRSSTNNEDLPGFSGAGLYDSFTHRPDEGHLSNSVKQVYASLWNFRAFEEREFYKIDHTLTAMGVLLHRNFDDERVNGVAVTADILYGEYGYYYINSQVGEDLVTNPKGQSVPEEVLLGWWDRDGHRVVRKSNRIADDKQVLTAEELGKMRPFLARIHGRFSKLYKKDLNDDTFAMEVEFKVTKEGNLVIKQARPWVFAKPKEEADSR